MQRVLWLDGLPLAPQHFQEADRLQADALEQRLRSTFGTSWGLRRVGLDTAALREGVVRVEHLDAVFADGTVVRVAPGADTTIDDRRVTELGPDRSEVCICVAIASARRGRREVGIDGARLRVVERTCVDTDTETPAEAVMIEVGVPALRIVLAHEDNHGLETLPLAYLRRDERGEVVATSAIVGPLLCVAASAPLVARVAQLVERLGSRRTALLAARHERDAKSIDVDGVDPTRFALATAIATHQPVLRHQLRSADTRPIDLYERLLSLAGALSVLSVDAEMDLPILDPLVPHAAFTAVFERIDALLLATDRDRARTIPLEARGDGLHFARLDDVAAAAEHYYLAVRSVLAPREVETSLAGLAKVASYGEIAGVLETATPGAPLQLVHRPPPEVPLRAGETCFELPFSDRYLRAAIAERGIAVYLPARSYDPAHTKLALIAVAPRNPRRGAEHAAAPSGHGEAPHP